MSSRARKADIQLLEDDDQIEQMQQEEEGWELVPLRGKTIGIRTSTMDDKNMAIELLVVYAQVLEGSFAPYVADIMEKIALPGLAFFFHDPVRFVSAKLVPQLLSSYKKAYGNPSNELTGSVERNRGQAARGAHRRARDRHPGRDVPVLLTSLSRSWARTASMRPTWDGFIDAVHSTLEDYKERVAQRAEEKEGATADDAEDEAGGAAPGHRGRPDPLSDMNKAFHCVFKYHGSSFLRGRGSDSSKILRGLPRLLGSHCSASGASASWMTS